MIHSDYYFYITNELDRYFFLVQCLALHTPRYTSKMNPGISSLLQYPPNPQKIQFPYRGLGQELHASEVGDHHGRAQHNKQTLKFLFQ